MIRLNKSLNVTKLDENTQENVYNYMFQRLRKLYSVHSQSSEYFRGLSNGIRIPSIVITGVSGILSFVATSTMLNDSTKLHVTVAVGILAVLSTMAQSFSSAFKYDAKMESHQKTAHEYDKLLTRVKFEEIIPDEGNEFFTNLETIILEIKNKCNYYIPSHILKQWEEAHMEETTIIYNYEKHKKELKDAKLAKQKANKEAIALAIAQAKLGDSSDTGTVPPLSEIPLPDDALQSSGTNQMNSLEEGVS